VQFRPGPVSGSGRVGGHLSGCPAPLGGAGVLAVGGRHGCVGVPQGGVVGQRGLFRRQGALI
jgi:hypothetical protein